MLDRPWQVILKVGLTLAERLAARATNPDRPEPEVHNRLVGPHDAMRLVQSLSSLRASRPRAIWVDARGSLAATVDILRSHLGPPTYWPAAYR